jgi:TonB family protein
MKLCSTCQEEFADRFSFCPVDGTPLNAVPAKAVEPSVTNTEETIPSIPAPGASFAASDEAAAAIPANDGEYHLTIIEDAGLTHRLITELRERAHESQLTWPEFKRDPMGFTKRSAQAYGSMLRGFFSNPNVAVAMIASVLSMLLIVVGVVWLERHQAGGVPRVAIVLFSLLALGAMVSIFASWLKRDRSASMAGAEPADTGSVVIATLAAFIFVLSIVGGVIWADHRRQQMAEDKQRQDVEFLSMTDIPMDQEELDKGTAGMNKGTGGGSKPKQDKPGGGGGGGREEQKPASQGKLPQASLTIPQVLAPDPNPPKIKNPSLPVAATIDADPLLFPTDTRPIPYGDPKSKSTETSSGPGTGNGIGTGTGGGVGSGEGGGVGPGRGGNTGGGDRHEGGGGPGGGGGGGEDYKRVFNPREVTQKARIISKPEPQYTEEARKNQISGTVVLRAVLSSGGSVTGIRAVSRLPYGLTEKAIAAASRIQFTPAMKDGRPVSQYVQIEYNFNLY